MNRQPASFDWNLARAFLATVEEGSLSAAARALGLTQPTLGRQVAALEAELNVVLFERIGRSLVLTQSGLDLLDPVRAMREAANRVSLVASGQSQSVAGKVRITATDIMSAHILPLVLCKLREVAPMVEIDIVAANDIRDLQLREADIAVRHVRPDQPELVAKLVGQATAHFYASKAYLSHQDHPTSFEDLRDHQFVGFGDNDRLIALFDEIGLRLTNANFLIGSESGVVAWELARQGYGIIVMSDDVAAHAPDMERILPDMEPIVFPIWLAVHRELATSRRIRLVFDLLVEYFSER